jgi:hypothetical protein
MMQQGNRSVIRAVSDERGQSWGRRREAELRTNAEESLGAFIDFGIANDRLLYFSTPTMGFATIVS